MKLASSNAPTSSKSALPDDPMAVHSGRKVYFEHLEADPYGFNDAAYDWPQDTRFALATAAFYATVLCGVLGMVRAGILPTFNPESLGYFAGALVLLFVGKCFFSWLVLHFRIKVNYVRKLGLRPWKKLAAFVVPIVITQGSTVLTDWIVLFALGSLVGLATEWAGRAGWNSLRQTHVPGSRDLV